MPERDTFSDAFEENPFEDLDPIDMHAELQWGKSLDGVWDIDAPEPLVAIGELAGLDFMSDGVELWTEDTAPFLAVGRDSNMLYVIPRKRGAPACDVPHFDPHSSEWICVGPVSQTDYYSNKGSEPAYYYHNHQGPFPVVWEHVSGCRILMPADNNGQPSYAVAKEGIVG